jgi:HSP20 family protein
MAQEKGQMEVATMLLRTDPFRDLDRFTQEVLGTAARPAAMPMDAWRDGDEFHVEFDLPGINADSLDLDIENNVVTVRAERAPVDSSREMLAAERPRGVFSRQLVLGNNLDTGRITADYRDGVLRLVIPVAEKAKPRKITVSRGGNAKAIDEGRVITEDGSPVTDTSAKKEPVNA